MKLLFTILFTCTLIGVFAQSKKDIIDSQTKTIDSLTTVSVAQYYEISRLDAMISELNKTIKANEATIKELKDKNAAQELSINELTDKNTLDEAAIKVKDSLINEKDNKLKSLSAQIETLNVSIKALNDTINQMNKFIEEKTGIGSVKDLDGNDYITRRIGDQTWMAENLNVAKFRNGDTIPQAKTAQEWEKAGIKKQPAWCYYENNTENGNLYGKLYNWYALNDARGLAPEGWHIPTDAEWSKLVLIASGNDKDPDQASAIAGNKLKGSSGWNENGNGSNESGFNGLAGGYCDTLGVFNNIGINGVWWTSTLIIEDIPEDSSDNVVSRTMQSNSNSVIKNYIRKSDGASVRCVKN